jgi:peptidoglycan hydrolase-like protein with peptidoglycan-binding domain
MELASYIYAAWAYEEAHQGSNALDFDAGLAMDKNLDLPDLVGLAKLPHNWQIRMIALLAIANSIAIHAAPAIAANAPEPAVNTAPWCNNLYLCDTSYMLEVQKLLAQRGYGVAIDGVYGGETKQAVTDFQKNQTSLKADGIPGQQTIALLRSAGSSSKSSPSSASKSPINPSPNPQFQPNSQISPPIAVPPITISKSNSAIDSEIGNLQLLLKQRGFYEGAADGLVGRSTTNAVIKAQQAYGLIPDGFVGPLTIRALLSGGADQPVSQQPFSKLPNAKDVRDIQELLQARGFYNGIPDGIYGTQTKDSILKAQLAYGQTATGESTPALVTALQLQNWRSPTANSTAVNLPPTTAPPQPPQSNNPANPPPIPNPNTNPNTNVPANIPSANMPSINPNINVNFNTSPRMTPNIIPKVINGINANGQAPSSGQNAPI